MLPVSRSVSPPGIVCDYRHQFRSIEDVIPVEISVHRFVAYRTAYPRPFRTAVKSFSVFLSYTTAYDTSQFFIERIEYPGVRHVFHSRDEFYFMVDAVFPEPVHNQCGVVGLVPSFPVRPCPVRRPFTIVDGICRCAENHVALRIFFEVSDEAAHGRALKRGIGVYVRRKCFRGDKEGDGAVHHSVCEPQEFFRLFLLCHPTEFVIRVDIRL